MDQAAVTGKPAGFRWEIPLATAIGVVLACLMAPACGEEAGRLPAEMVVAEARTDVALRMDVQTSTLPRMDAQDNGFQAPRVDVAVFPRNRQALGAVVGMSGFTPRAGLQASGLQAPNLQPLGLQPMRPSIDLGVRFSHRLNSQKQIDITAWRRMTAEDDAYLQTQVPQPVYGARIEMDMKPVRKTGFGLDRGFIGLQLQSGARITIKRRNGGPMIYYRTSF